MAGNYRTPGVYVEEISKLPPSVAQVETAVPAFIGYTEKAEKDGKNLHDGPKDAQSKLIPTPVRITSILDYVAHFGGAPRPGSIEVDLLANNSVSGVNITPQWYLYYSLQMFFANGGGKCYIVSVGDYDDNDLPDKDALISGIEAIKKIDEPTLLVVPDAVILSSDDEIASVQQTMLAQCAQLKDRFALLDIKHADQEVYNKEEVDTFRDKIGINDLDYGAAYFPWLKTTLSLDFSFSQIAFNKGSSSKIPYENVSGQSDLVKDLKNVVVDK